MEQTVGFCPHHCVAFAAQLLEARAVKHGDMTATVGNHPKPLQLPGRIGHAFAPHAEHVGDYFLRHGELVVGQPIETQQQLAV